jgi:hypothetical protein
MPKIDSDALEHWLTLSFKLLFGQSKAYNNRVGGVCGGLKPVGGV